MTTPIKKPGRPTIGEAPLSPAEKQRRYRDRQRDRKTEKMFETSEKSRVTLIESLAECLKYLDRTDISEIVRDNNKWVAGKIIHELATRYEIKC